MSLVVPGPVLSSEVLYPLVGTPPIVCFLFAPLLSYYLSETLMESETPNALRVPELSKAPTRSNTYPIL